MHPLDVAGYQRSGVDDGDARALAEGTGLEEQQKVQPHLGLTFDEAIVRDGVGELLAHVLTDISEVERLEVVEMLRMEQHEYCHHLAVRKTA